MPIIATPRRREIETGLSDGINVEIVQINDCQLALFFDLLAQLFILFFQIALAKLEIFDFVLKRGHFLFVVALLGLRFSHIFLEQFKLLEGDFFGRRRLGSGLA